MMNWSRGKTLAGWFINILVVVLVPILLHSFVLDVRYIPSTSMVPSLLEGDRVLVAPYAYGYTRFSVPFGIWSPKGRLWPHSPHRGDIVAFRFPGPVQEDYVKRVIGLPGDTIQVRQGVVWLNGAPIPLQPQPPRRMRGAYGTIEVPIYKELLPNHPHLVVQLPGQGPLANTVLWTVPAGCIFVMGDNRDNSSDSRAPRGVGMLPMDRLEGQVTRILSSRVQAHSWWLPWYWRNDIRWHRWGQRVD